MCIIKSTMCIIDLDGTIHKFLIYILIHLMCVYIHQLQLASTPPFIRVYRIWYTN
jgi:hypothetical protein